MAEHGGYRKPSKPAPVSGPGKLSKRTDGGPAQKLRPTTGGPYGDAASMTDLQRSAPMAADGPSPAQQAPSSAPPPQPVNVTPFGAPSTKPDEPVTSGNPLGAGVGPEAMGVSNPLDQADQQDARRLLDYLPVLEFIANQPGSSAAMKAYVRQIKAMNVQ